jgi:hypothetical protein
VPVVDLATGPPQPLILVPGLEIRNQLGARKGSSIRSKLVVLGHAVGAAGRAGLDLAGAQATARSAIVASSVSPLRWLVTLV